MQLSPYAAKSIDVLTLFPNVRSSRIDYVSTGLYVTSPHESSHPDDNWGFVVTYLNSISRSNTTASIKNITTTAAASATSTHASDSARRIFAFRAISDEIDDPESLSKANATLRSRHLHHSIKDPASNIQRSKSASVGSQSNVDAEDDDDAEGCISSKRKVQMIVDLLRECCIDAGAFDPEDEQEEKPFVTHMTIQRYVAESFLSLYVPLEL